MINDALDKKELLASPRQGVITIIHKPFEYRMLIDNCRPTKHY